VQIVSEFSSFKLVVSPLQSGAVGPYSVWGTWFPSHLSLEETRSYLDLLDLLALGNILLGGVVDKPGLYNNNLLLTVWWMGDMALSGVLPRHNAIVGVVASTTTVEADKTRGSSSGRWHRQVQHRRWWW
jgi:hypothetical protein